MERANIAYLRLSVDQQQIIQQEQNLSELSPGNIS